MERITQHIVIVGGGTAGWLSACYLAARLPSVAPGTQITLIESPDVPVIGVGEGTWPTMRSTLMTIGIDEAEFLAACDGSFKQGSRFDGWVDGSESDSYLHPFTAPPPGEFGDLLAAWSERSAESSFADAMTSQAQVCDKHLAPRQAGMAPFSGALNYAYHLDAGKFATVLSRHAVERLGVRHLPATVTGIRHDEAGGISAVETGSHGEIAGDLFIDCSGFRAVLIGALGGGWHDLSGELLNDRALALQLPVDPRSPLASQTISTAHRAGWLWDIGLPSRRGIGCVYASRHMSDEEAAEELRRYVATIDPAADIDRLSPRLLRFPAGHRDRFWVGNCLAVGLSAGFIEPLEASAIVLIELSLKALADNFPRRRATMPVHADRFNRLFGLRWRRIADFLKLHYALSRRSEPYWLAQRDPRTLSPELIALLDIWRDQPPSPYDFPLAEEIFPAASHQYVYYGMMGPPDHLPRPTLPATAVLDRVRERSRQLLSALPSNRDYLARLGSQDAASATAARLAV